MINIMGENEQAIDYLLTLAGGKYDQLWTLKSSKQLVQLLEETAFSFPLPPIYRNPMCFSRALL